MQIDGTVFVLGKTTVYFSSSFNVSATGSLNGNGAGLGPGVAAANCVAGAAGAGGSHGGYGSGGAAGNAGGVGCDAVDWPVLAGSGERSRHRAWCFAMP